MTLRKTLWIATALALAPPAIAQEPIRAERIEFLPGATSKAIRGTVRGEGMVDYVVGAQVGQTMIATLRANNASAYFTIVSRRKDQAVFLGSAQGTSFRSPIQETGDYRIRVFLMRDAAQRDERADYTLMVSLAQAPARIALRGGRVPNGSGEPIAPDNMAAFCRGEASQMYGARPVYVKTEASVRQGWGNSIDGTVDKGTEGIKRFQCRFDGQGRFIDVMALTPDGE